MPLVFSDIVVADLVVKCYIRLLFYLNSYEYVYSPRR